MSDTVKLSRTQNIGLGVFLITSAFTALDMGGFILNLQLGLPAYLVIATLGGIVGGALLAAELRWAGAIAGAIAAPCGLLVLVWWVTGRDKVYSVEVVLVEMIAAGIPGCLIYFPLQALVKTRGRVTVDDSTISFQSPRGAVQSIQWSDVEAVEIESTTKIFGSLCYVLKGPNGVCKVPEDAKGFSRLRDRLEELPGWDNEAFLAAFGATEAASSCAWRSRPEEEDTPQGTQ